MRTHYQTFFTRLHLTRKPDPQADMLKQAELVKALEIRASQERMRLHLMLMKGKAA